MRPFTLSSINISATSGLVTKCYEKYHLGMGSVLGFGSDRIRILVSFATDSSHRVLMGKTVLPLSVLKSFFTHFLGCYKIVFKLACNEDIHILIDFKFQLNWTSDWS